MTWATTIRTLARRTLRSRGSAVLHLMLPTVTWPTSPADYVSSLEREIVSERNLARIQERVRDLERTGGTPNSEQPA